VPAEAIVQRIVLLRGQKVLLDADLARLYGVQTRALVQAVKRNPNRFPEDFMFTLSNQELAVLRSQSVISNAGHGGRRSAPYAFTEQGVAMLLSVLNSPQAVRVNIAIMRVRQDARSAGQQRAAGCKVRRTGAQSGNARPGDRRFDRDDSGIDGTRAGFARAADRILVGGQFCPSADWMIADQ
jgi:hypothetical protein